jgi:hypothetical protein
MIMAGMFYSLKEAAQKLNRTEAEVRQLAKEGKLREFRDGAILLFKIEEVEALLADTSVPAKPLVERPKQPAKSTTPVEPKEPVEVESELVLPETPEPDLRLEAALGAEPELNLEEVPEPESGAELELPVEDEQAQPVAEAEPVAEQVEGEEISLISETSSLPTESDITTMDTALTGQGVSVLGEADTEYQKTDDTMAETVAPTGTTTEASLEEIEEDVNLDSFGSGSGLLDLSLQADDTSLGGILDEIYTAEAGEEAKAAAGAGPASPAAEVAAEAEQIAPEESLASAEVMTQVPALAQAYVEPAPDVQSNTFGILLFLPLLVLLYTTIVVVAAQRGVMPSILTAVQNLIWYIMIAAILVGGLVVGGAFFLSRDRTKAAPKAKKEEKPKKEKKTKKGKETPKEEEQ